MATPHSRKDEMRSIGPLRNVGRCPTCRCKVAMPCLLCKVRKEVAMAKLVKELTNG